jgi:TolB-like protein/DNA-binding winged helix-turn-helix (wHTH) protein/Tfp pilus assembly protein PilF
MEPVTDSRVIYRFGACELDAARFELRRQGESVRLEKNPLELLFLLLEARGELVTRQQILDRLWGPDVFVDVDQGINTAIRKIRRAIAGDIDPIQTVVGKGYRFALPIEIVEREVVSTKAVGRPKLVVPIAVIIAALVLVAVVAYLRTRPAQIRSLAVLPFDNFSRDPQQDYFVDGMTDAIITRVAQRGDFKVISRTSVMHLKGTHRDLRDIARELQVDAVVEGSVLREGSRVRINAQFIDARTDRHLWAQLYDRDVVEILQLQDEVASKIADSIGSTLDSRRASQVSGQRVDPAAYDSYLRARSLSQQRTPTSLAQSIELYQRALDAQPRYAEAWAGLADAYAALGYNSFVSPEESFPKAKSAALKALEFDPESAEAHAALGYSLFYYDWNIASAEKEFDSAIRANPNFALSYHWRSVVRTSQSQTDEAQRDIAMARTLDPLSLLVDTDIGFELYYSGRYDDAIRHLSAVGTVAPNFPPAHLWLGRAYEQKKMYPQAIAELTRANQLVPDWSVTIAALAHAKAVAGDSSGARTDLRHLEALSRLRFVTPYAMALVYAGLRDNDTAFHWLDRAYSERSHWLMWLRIDPRFENLHQDARFQALVDKIVASSR